jgi:hypothetical protein
LLTEIFTMNLERYIYLDVSGLASLYAQLRGEDVVETLTSMEHSRASGLKLAIAAFLGLSAGGESTNEARKVAKKSRASAWFDAKHLFSVPPTLDEFNKAQAVLFVSGFPPYDNPSRSNPPISMSARLQNFPSAQDGQLSVSGHDALLFRRLNGKPHLFSVFGSVFESGDGFQVKPYAIRL